MPEQDDDEKRGRILDAAFAKFSAYGFGRTSMADIAEAAEMSRPALYQHFGNKEEIFREMLARILDDAAGKALVALDQEHDLEAQLDGFLQRWFGDLTESFRATAHGADLVEAKAGHARPVVEANDRRIRKAVSVRLQAATGPTIDVADLVDLLLLAPVGLKADDPSMPRLRRRLRSLASSVAGLARG